MNDESHPNPEFTHSATCDPGSTPHASGMFSHSQQFTVMGGTFTNITKNYTAAPSLPSDFPMIPMGDIDLRHQIRVDERSGIINYQPRGRACVRRVHSAKAIVAGRKLRATVAMYEGNGAEEEWRQDIAKYMSLRRVECIFALFICLLTRTTRHPNIVQICGAASSNGIHATLFNDGSFGSSSRFPFFDGIYLCVLCMCSFRLLRAISLAARTRISSY
ncbi:hypothetical protein MSAN_00118100 [Mycena sanguinolenta]|uniref:Uncharacterized protein n=1 Tax=Mycena sanguinolenta TaxID=230812 RepID=A0A8H6ZGJ2_9AGAR|nr:hypothetical protein MSAN_00118100 [Mycena sanguinolenta]